MEPKIIVHGGAAILQELTDQCLDGVKRAAQEGNRLLTSGGSAIDAVVAAVSILEDDIAFNAGCGSALTRRQEIEMDASVMDGSSLGCGGVGCVRDIANPIQLAKAVMDKTDHCLLVDKGANEFAEEMGIPRLPPGALKTAKAKKEWVTYKEYMETIHGEYSRRDPSLDTPCDTVGAVALDKYGNLASATSTGGITGKKSGRTGDSPIIGAGIYADNESCAASSTGQGEAIMKMCLTRRVAESVERGCSAQEAVDSSLEIMNKKLGQGAGIIVITKTGEVAHAFTTMRMAWADIQNKTLSFGIDPDQLLQQQIDI